MSLPKMGPTLIKLTATGNDFLLLDLTEKAAAAAWGALDRSKQAKLWCDRHEGLGADGFVVLEADAQVDFAWDFYNSDGGSAEMCGNAARAVSLYMSLTRNQTSFHFRTRVGLVHATVRSADDIEVELPPVTETEQGEEFTFVRSGVPHAVVQITDPLDRVHQREIALRLKRQSRFAREGVNVTFMTPLKGHRLESVTFERGVEDFTLSCGTGAVAAAFAALGGKEGHEIEVGVPGGQLNVLFKDGKAHLRGPARVVAQIQVFNGPGGLYVD